jgi:hypothetical protein
MEPEGSFLPSQELATCRCYSEPDHSMPTSYFLKDYFNPLAPNDVCIRRTAQLTSRRCILNIYSTNILTEYFKHAARSPFFFLFKMPFIL